MWSLFVRIVLGVAVGGMAFVPPWLTEAALHVQPVRKTRVPDTEAAKVCSAWQTAEVTAQDGAVLRGWYFTPEKPLGKSVLLLHGVGDTRRGMLGFARYFVQQGFAVLAADSRNHGVSGGESVTYGLLERGDVRAWADYMEARQPGTALYGLGESMGAAILIQAAPGEPRLRSIVAECSYASFREAALERIPRFTGLPRWFATPVFEAGMLYSRLRYGLDLGAASPLDAIRGLRKPVLLIHGLDDRNTAPYQSRLLHEANREFTELWEVPGARHVQASVVAEEEFKRRVLRWFEK